MSTAETTPRNIRTWSDWEDALDKGQTTEAERKLVAACRAGKGCTLGDGSRPAAPSDSREVGADLLRYLIIGGCDGCDLHEIGVALRGAYIKDALNLMYCTAVGMTRLVACRFDQIFMAEQAKFELLNLEGSACGALNAQGAEVKGSVFLRNGFVAKGEVRLSSAMIGGQLSCENSTFENADGFALNAQDAEVNGTVFLSHGFSTKGAVSFSGAVIGGQLSCNGGMFANADGVALNAQGAQMSELHWRGLAAVDGAVNLMGTKADNLVDDAASWALPGRFYLDGFTYKSLHGPLDAPMRLTWLAKACAYNGSFSPQPYEQLAHVLKRMGHEQTARQILVSKERMHRQSERGSLRFRRRLARLVAQLSKRQDEVHTEAVNSFSKNAGSADVGFVNRLFERYRLFHISWPASKKNTLPPQEIARAQAGFREELFWHNGRIRARIAWMQLKDRMARHLVGYGYRPFNFIWALALLIGVGWLFAHQAYERGDFAPNSDVILSTADWQALAEGESANPAKDWAAQTGKGRDYESFNSFAYAVDVVIPIVAIGQEAAWAPSTNRGPWGATLWWLRWVLTILGWIVTAVGAAAITGIIRRE